MSRRARTLWVVAGALCAAGVVIATVTHCYAARAQEKRKAVLEYLQSTIARKDVETLSWTKGARPKGVWQTVPDRDARQAWKLLTGDWEHVREIDSGKAEAKVANFAGPRLVVALRVRESVSSLVEVRVYSHEAGHVVIIFQVNDGPYVGTYYLEDPAPSNLPDVEVRVMSSVPAPNP